MGNSTGSKCATSILSLTQSVSGIPGRKRTTTRCLSLAKTLPVGGCTSTTPSRAPPMMPILKEKATFDWFMMQNSLSSRLE